MRPPKPSRPDYRSEAAAQYRKLYKTSRWRKLRARQLDHAPLCSMCAALGRTEAATIVDHIKPHRGEPGLFWDMANLQSLCVPCHDRHKQAQERSGTLPGADVDGLPLDPEHHWR